MGTCKECKWFYHASEDYDYYSFCFNPENIVMFGKVIFDFDKDFGCMRFDDDKNNNKNNSDGDLHCCGNCDNWNRCCRELRSFRVCDDWCFDNITYSERL